jgi:hypothetical protein
MLLQEIFKTNPGLLEEPEVKRLIDYVSGQHERSYKIWMRDKDRVNEVLWAVMNSEVFVIGGTPAKEALQRVVQILE